MDLPERRRSEPVTVTGTTILDGLRDPDNRTIWGQYVDRYRPLVLAFCERLGLSAEDAEDVAQASLLAFSQSYVAGSYDRARGRLRDWLHGIVKNQVKSTWRRMASREEQGPLDLEQLTSREDLGDIWEEEWRDAVLGHCLTLIRHEVEEQTYEAFELFVLEELPATEVAERLGVTPNTVYGAKRRILERLRELKPIQEEEF